MRPLTVLEVEVFSQPNGEFCHLAVAHQLNVHSNRPELTVGLAAYFAFYNTDRPHQGISNKKPDDVYATRQGGGASIPDYFSDARGVSPESLHSIGDTPQEQTGQRCSAAVKEMDLA